MKPEEYLERQVEVDGWPVRLTSYRLGEQFHCTADNVSPGGNLTRAKGPTREDAESKALDEVKEMLKRTTRRPV
jgi:hypothetical protein